MTSTDAPVRRVAVLGTGLMGASIALAASRVGCRVRGWDADPDTLGRAGGLDAASSLEEAVRDAEVVVIATPIPTIPDLVARALGAAPQALVTDAGSIKDQVVTAVGERVSVADLARYVPGHPMGGSERSGPDHASASVLDGIVWVLTPTGGTDAALADRLERWVVRLGARPVRMDPTRHDRLVAFVSHLPQVASTALMALAAIEESDEPEILLLAAGGFRDLTRLASSNALLWGDILVTNRAQVGAAIDLYLGALTALRDAILAGDGDEVRATFDLAKRARLRLATKPQVKAGVAVLLVPVPDRPGALAELTAGLGEGGVNIEDLQILHSPEGGRGTVHLTVAAGAADDAARVLAAQGFDPTRLA